MTQRRPEWTNWSLVATLALFAAACGGSDIDLGPTPTATRTGAATPTQGVTATVTVTRTPTQASASAVNGLLVVQRSVGSGSDALGAPPAFWEGNPEKASFDRALSHADWTVIGADQAGVTGSDGRFVIAGLAPGRYTLQVSRTLDGNLASVSVPFTVGDGGAAEVVAEMSWGLVKSISTYTLDGAQMRDVVGPNGTRLVTRDGRVVELSDWSRTLIDSDGDGRFDTLEVTEIFIANGPTQLVLGQSGSFYATARLSDGTTLDVTYLADWRSSSESVATIDSWGAVSALALGTTSLTATVGDLTSAPWPLTVMARPALRRIYVQNASCIYTMGAPRDDTRPPVTDPPATGILPAPNCTQVVQIGATIQFQATGEFDDGYYEDITDEVAWQLVPPEIGEVVAGLFTAKQAGTTKLSASLSGVVSEATDIRVVTEPTVVALSIYANNDGFAVIDARVGADGMRPEPCFDCGYSITVLRGDTLQFRATAQYDTGAWEDATDKVTWRSNNDDAAPIDAAGVMSAVAAGDATITATLGEVSSNLVGVHVVNDATLVSLSIYQEGGERVVGKGDQRFFRATGFYDVGFARDVTKEATWHSSDPSVGGFDSAGVFTARAAGIVKVWAELAGKQSNQEGLEVFETSEIGYCDPANVNRGVWSDDFNRVVLESDCAQYSQPGVATLRYTVTETQPHGGVFDPCLDLYVYQGETRVRTIREEGCGDPFLPLGAPGRDDAEVKYQLRAFWDLKDETGTAVAPGTYTIYGRFYLYYDPVVSITLTVLPAGHVAPPLADLVPLSATLNLPPAPACISDYQHLPSPLVDVCVANQGAGAAGPFVVSLAASSGAGEDKFTVAGLAAGEQRCISRPGLFYLDVIAAADITGTVAESDETNNRQMFFVPPPPTATPPPTCTPGGPLPTSTPTRSPRPVCTPPPCAPGQVYYCPGECPGGCGTTCVTPLPTPPPEGACFYGSQDCSAGSPELTTQEKCCMLARYSMSPLAFSWCPADHFTADGQCDACTKDPCDGLPPEQLPDLIPSDVRLSGCLLDNCYPRPAMAVCVANQGEAPSGSFYVSVNGGLALYFSGLAAGDEQCLETPYVAPAVVVADAGGWVAESREDNNTREFVPPTPEATACDVLPSDCTPGMKTPTPTPFPACTPPRCGPDQAYHCPDDDCPGGCGMICVMADGTIPPTPTMVP
ncbi:MAG: Ig-like domain-containing protein [Deltaproteobacteria bacterium]|nr:Ig-like domain-containing protein [Deltaproteobacteria bacterium]